jgi:hypothetical protein
MARLILDDDEFDILSVLDGNQMIAFLESTDCLDFNEADFAIKSMRTRQKKINEMKNVLVEHVKANCTCIL